MGLITLFLELNKSVSTFVKNRDIKKISNCPERLRLKLMHVKVINFSHT